MILYNTNRIAAATIILLLCMFRKIQLGIAIIKTAALYVGVNQILILNSLCLYLTKIIHSSKQGGKKKIEC